MTTRTRKLMIIVLLALGASTAGYAESVFSGLWSADMTLSGIQTAPITAFSSRLEAAVSVFPLELSSRSDFSNDAWLWQSFGLSADVAFFSMGSSLLFLPDPWSFAYASGYVRLDLGLLSAAYYTAFIGTMFDGTLYQGSVLEIGSTFGPIQFQGLTYLGATLDGVLFVTDPAFVPCQPEDCPAPSPAERFYRVFPFLDDTQLFTGQSLRFTGQLANDLTITSITTLSSAGFESQEFRMEIWSLGGIPIVLDLSLRYAIQTKSLQITPRFGVGNRNCYGTLLVELITDDTGALIRGFSVYGLDLHMRTPHFAFRSLTLFDSDRFSLYQGKGYSLDDIWVDEANHGGSCGTAGSELTEYWEVIGFAVYRGDPCCRHLTFVALSFFGSAVDNPFSWMESQFRAEFAPMSGFSLRTGLTLSKSGISSWALGITIIW